MDGLLNLVQLATLSRQGSRKLLAASMDTVQMADPSLSFMELLLQLCLALPKRLHLRRRSDLLRPQLRPEAPALGLEIDALAHRADLGRLEAAAELRAQAPLPTKAVLEEAVDAANALLEALLWRRRTANAPRLHQSPV